MPNPRNFVRTGFRAGYKDSAQTRRFVRKAERRYYATVDFVAEDIPQIDDPCYDPPAHEVSEAFDDFCSQLDDDGEVNERLTDMLSRPSLLDDDTLDDNDLPTWGDALDFEGWRGFSIRVMP